MVLNVYGNHTSYSGRGDGGKGMGGGGEVDYIPTTTPSPPECIKMGSDESHFNVSLIVGDKVTR